MNRKKYLTELSIDRLNDYLCDYLLSTEIQEMSCEKFAQYIKKGPIKRYNEKENWFFTTNYLFCHIAEFCFQAADGKYYWAFKSLFTPDGELQKLVREYNAKIKNTAEELCMPK